jgi:head-tail adaptor
MSFMDGLRLDIAVTRNLGTTRDSGNQIVPDFQTVATEKGRIDTRSAKENEAGRRVAATGIYRAMMRAGADVRADDRLICEGRTYQVTGPPREQAGAGGAIHHLTIELKAVS